ncbi:SusE domain-containing protein [Chitinophaga sp. sic0106]|uniref:SusE domain-containing protein n=1 Tax=Chitinophaga sp. sic0106 TaxID=2854785 RepID=UPI001C45C2D2|nr:SusE domain-containing protein [Chitinophaga sp. sic0106]MBV7530331.1 SusE domain-containing protein [Chitinophaga sp. sic0106]
MKSTIYQYIIAGLFVATLWSCKKDEIKTIAQVGTAPALSATVDTVILLKDHAADNAVTFKWNASSFGFNGVVKYSLEFARKGNNFATVKAVTADTLSKTLTIAELNTIANGLEVDNGVPADLEVRVKATISENYQAAYSNTQKLVVSSYLDLIDYPSMYAPGDYQGWNPAGAAKVVSLKSDKVYEGYA